MKQPTWVEQIIFQIVLPLPPSANKRMTVDNGRMISSKLTRQWKQRASTLLLKAKADQVLAMLGDTKYELAIHLDCWFDSLSIMTKNDADNRIKSAQDAVAAALGIDDSHFYRTSAQKAGVDNWQPACIKVTVLALIGNVTEGLGNAY